MILSHMYFTLRTIQLTNQEHSLLESETIKQELQAAKRILDEFRRLDPDMPIQTCLLFILIAQNEGSSQSIFEKALGISRSSISRGAARISQYGWNSKPGLNLVDMREDPADRRYKVLSLTSTGRQLITQIVKAIRNGSS